MSKYNISQAKPKAPRKSSRQSGRSSGNVTAPTIKQVLTHLNALRQNGDKIKFGFYTPEEDQLEELKEIRDKCKITASWQPGKLFLFSVHKRQYPGSTLSDERIGGRGRKSRIYGTVQSF